MGFLYRRTHAIFFYPHNTVTLFKGDEAYVDMKKGFVLRLETGLVACRQKLSVSCFFQVVSSLVEECILVLGTVYSQFQCSNVVFLSNTRNGMGTIP